VRVLIVMTQSDMMPQAMVVRFVSLLIPCQHYNSSSDVNAYMHPEDFQSTFITPLNPSSNHVLVQGLCTPQKSRLLFCIRAKFRLL